ncbi:MAG: DNA-processing protein DprA [Elusimicrobiota bacterium]|jgi:DNA processing protein
MMTVERFFWIFLNQVPFLGPLRFHRLLHAAGSAEAILAMPAQGLMAAEVDEALAVHWQEAFRDPRLLRQAEAEQRRADQGDCRIVTELDPDYPASLRELIGRPPVIYVQGAWPLPEGLALGMVGTRQSTSEGEAITERFTAQLAERGVLLVSGLAAGIDTVVHRTALDAQGKTAAVLGHGFEYVFPRENAALYKRMKAKGTLITEFPWSMPPQASNFPRRNRIISGLSRGVVVLEAPRRSGALITARYAAEQGRDVFAVPGPVRQGFSAGCHRLIQQGAKLVETIEDILDEYPGRAPQQAAVPPAMPCPPKKEPHQFAGLERDVMNQLSNQPISVEDLVGRLACPVDQLASALLSLELKGCICHYPGQHYAIKND